MKPLRVLICGTVLSQGVGGVRRHNVEILPRAAHLLEQSGGSLSVMASRDGLSFELPSEIQILTSDVPPRPALARFARESHALRGHLEVARKANRPFDLLHTAHLPAPHALDVPFTLLLHDLKSVATPTANSLRRFVGRRIIADAVHRAAAVCCVSRTLAAEVRALTDIDPGRLHVVPNGCDHLPIRSRAPSGDPFLLYVGRLEPRKNIELILRALSASRELASLVLAGDEQGEHGSKLRVLCDQLGVTDRVRFLGPVDDSALADLYARCAGVVLPSLREGFDLPLAEALRAGAPVAASDLAVHRELAGPNAVYFDPQLVQSALQALHALHERTEPTLLSTVPSTLPPTLNASTWDQAAYALVSAWLLAVAAR